MNLRLTGALCRCFFRGSHRFGKMSRRRTFDGALYLRYREYRAALGLVIAWGLLLIKTYYF